MIDSISISQAEGVSIPPQQERIDILKHLMPEVFDEGRIDFEKLKATLGEAVNFSNERYVLNWAGKSDAFRVMQCPSSATLVPCKDESVDFDTTQNIFIEGENMEVLKVLQKSYFGKVKMIYIDPPYNTGNDSFIYPDKFSETKEEYMKHVGDKDAEGYMTREGMFRKNSRENGQYHSNWLNMMMPRLYLAKSLLREDGVIFISIDDNEVHNLRLLMNEIFGEENFVGQITIINNLKGRNDKKNIATCHEYLLIYGKPEFEANGLPLSEEQLKQFDKLDENNNAYQLRDLRKRGRPDRREDRPNMYFPIYYDTQTKTCSLEYSPTAIAIYPKRGDNSDGRWRWGKERVQENLSILEPYFSDISGRWGINHRVYLNPHLNPVLNTEEEDVENENEERVSKSKSFWMGGEISTDIGRRTYKELMDDSSFDYPKPVEYIKKVISLGANSEAICLDFFAGSGTTAHAVMQLNKEDGGNRKFICVQLPELCDPNKEAYKAGYNTIAEISKERIRRASAKIRAEVENERAQHAGEISFEETTEAPMPDLGFKVFKLSESNFKQWREIHGSEQEQWKQQTIDFLNPVAANASIENMVYELMLKNGKNLNSTIEHSHNCYNIHSGELLLLLESVDQDTIDYVLSLHPQKVIALDNLFSGNDQLKTNTALQLRDAGITFKTI